VTTWGAPTRDRRGSLISGPCRLCTGTFFVSSGLSRQVALSRHSGESDHCGSPDPCPPRRGSLVLGDGGADGRRFPWRTNVSLVFSIRCMLPESSAAAPSNETRIAQAPVAERPFALPPAQAMELQMWITIFALTFATAIIFSVAAVSEAAFYRLKRAKYLVCVPRSAPSGGHGTISALSGFLGKWRSP
jgi:hypothetical protein